MGMVKKIEGIIFMGEKYYERNKIWVKHTLIKILG